MDIFTRTGNKQMRDWSNLLAMIVLSLMCTSCMSSKEHQQNKDGIKEAFTFAKSFLETNGEVIPNEDSTYFLCRMIDENFTTFGVTSLEQTVIYPKERIRGRVRWHANDKLAITRDPGILEDRRSEPSELTRIVELKQEH